MKTKEEALVWVRNFLNDVDTQDNAGTAQPLQVLLQVKREYVAHEEYNHRTEIVYHHPEMEGRSASSHVEAIQWLKDYGYEGKELQKEIGNIEEFHMGHYWDTEQMFFTHSGYKRHMDLNIHNYRGDKAVRPYVVHAFRNPEMREMVQALRIIIENSTAASLQGDEK